MLGIISVKNSEMIDTGEAMSDYLLYKGKLAPYTPSPSLRPHHIVVLLHHIIVLIQYTPPSEIIMKLTVPVLCRLLNKFGMTDLHDIFPKTIHKQLTYICLFKSDT